jgi:hypothetical protein
MNDMKDTKTQTGDRSMLSRNARSEASAARFPGGSHANIRVALQSVR